MIPTVFSFGVVLRTPKMISGIFRGRVIILAYVLQPSSKHNKMCCFYLFIIHMSPLTSTWMTWVSMTAKL